MQRLLNVSRALLATAACLALASTAQAAGGLNLSWSDCSTFGTMQRNFACASNTAPAHIMYGSAITGVDMGQLNGQASVLDLQTNQAALSNWWQLGAGGCRAGLISAGFDFTANVNCLDPWAGQAAGGINYTAGFGGANKARIRTVCAIPGSTSISGTDEYYFFKVTILNGKTTGNGSCAGCTDGACVVFNSIEVTQPLGVGDYKISNPLNRNWVQFQGGATGVSGGCPAATPTRNKTWGSVKSIYR